MLERIKLFLATLFLDLLANFLRFIMTLFIRNRNCLDGANLLGDLLAGVVGSEDPDLVTVGGSQGPLALGLTAHIQRSLANLKISRC